MKLSHPVDDGGYAEFRETVEHLFTDAPAGVSMTDLDEFGLFDLLVEEPVVAARALFEGQGAALGLGPTIDGYVVNALRAAGAELSEQQQYGVLYRIPGQEDAMFTLAVPGQLPTHFVFSSREQAGAALVVNLDEADTEVVRTIDPSVELRRVGASVEARASLILQGAGHLIENHVAVAVAMQLTGISEHLLTIGRDYSTIREQFGRPIAAFQAVQHLLADSAVAVGVAQDMTRVAVSELGHAQRADLAAIVAANAGLRALAVTTRAIQQVLGAVGYTTEHSFPKYYYRGQLLSYLIGAGSIDRRVAEVVHAQPQDERELMPVSSWAVAHQEAGQ